ncbi:hypothetical protein GLOTRDRAFT_131576 [Gloeophyllum trabeum ATCC 11539]|uniref:Uncharacterized protein n=1 Tax=Gloeophyllum trabeum (strain ATCC 11539 / FP-39264 / Madison 617) TaxID=670483 RepID=S7Q1C0_GLOTA|nr:uncharacterized protein GLOTRDRAFT_131576 [Gloeophyllum trabeum ATCC 11539]EPQ53307.1 hypothetical protein GLOTRDRAFT_131576 [Gloeophyllum trabeum ATCC 11539]
MTARQKRALKKPKSWWEAQIAFYVLKLGGKSKSIAAMQDSLRTAVDAGSLSVPQATLEVEAKLKSEYDGLRDQQYAACATDEERLRFDAGRFLRETFDAPVGLYVVKCKGREYLDHSSVRELAEKLELHTGGFSGVDVDGGHAQWVVVGRDEAVVREQADWIESEARRRSRELAEAEAHTSKKSKSKRSATHVDDGGNDGGWVIGRPAKRGRKASSQQSSEDGDLGNEYFSDEDLSNAASDEGEDDLEYTRDPALKPITNRKFPDALDVTGTWTISAPALAANWPDVSGNMHFNIAKLTTAKGKKGKGTSGDVLFAAFNLGILEGVIAFDKPPTPSSLETTFLWRGRETGEGEMQTAQDFNCGKLTFDTDRDEGKNTNKFTGVFASTYGTWNIEGTRVNSKAFSGSTFKEEYKGYTEEAYEYERVARWH